MIYTNSQNEKIELTRASTDQFKGQNLLVLHDDPPPLGSGRQAVMLLDEGTIEWLAEQLETIQSQMSPKCAPPEECCHPCSGGCSPPEECCRSRHTKRR